MGRRLIQVSVSRFEGDRDLKVFAALRHPSLRPLVVFLLRMLRMHTEALVVKSEMIANSELIYQIIYQSPKTQLSSKMVQSRNMSHTVELQMCFFDRVQHVGTGVGFQSRESLAVGIRMFFNTMNEAILRSFAAKIHKLHRPIVARVPLCFGKVGVTTMIFWVEWISGVESFTQIKWFE